MPYDQPNHRRPDRDRPKRPRAAVEREAEHILNQSLAAARDETTAPSTPFETLKNRVAERALDSVRARDRLPRRVLAAITLHRKLSIGLATAGIVALFMTLVPFSYERTVGYELIAAWASEEVPTDRTETVEADTEPALLAQPDEPATVSDSPRVNVREPAVGTIPDSADAPRVTLLRPRVIVGDETGRLLTPAKVELVALSEDGSPGVIVRAQAETLNVRPLLAGTPGRVIVRPIVIKESESLYSRVKTDLFIQTQEDDQQVPKEVFESLMDGLDLDSLSDYELQEEITARLEARGLSRYRVSLIRDETGPDGERRMIVGVSTESDLEPVALTATGLLDSLLEGLDLQDPDLSDAELEMLIQERLTRRGKTGARVEIYTDWDGQRKVRIRLQKIDEDN